MYLSSMAHQGVEGDNVQVGFLVYLWLAYCNNYFNEVLSFPFCGRFQEVIRDQEPLPLLSPSQVSSSSRCVWHGKH